MPETSGLETTAGLNTKISEAENEVPHISKYITTQEFNKLTRDLYQLIYGTKMILIIN